MSRGGKCTEKMCLNERRWFEVLLVGMSFQLITADGESLCLSNQSFHFFAPLCWFIVAHGLPACLKKKRNLKFIIVNNPMQKLSVLQRHISFNIAASWSPGGIHKLFQQISSLIRTLLCAGADCYSFQLKTAQQATWKPQLSQDHFSSRKPSFPFPVS